MAQFPHASVPVSLQEDEQAANFFDDARLILKDLRILGEGIYWAAGTGSPEGVHEANVGSLYTRLDGGAGTTLYVKESGTSSTGWAPK
jgi:hypothetical protein